VTRLHSEQLPMRPAELCSMTLSDLAETIADREHCWRNNESGKGAQNGKVYAHCFAPDLLRSLQTFVESVRPDSSSSAVLVDFNGVALTRNAISELLRHYVKFAAGGEGDVREFIAEERIHSTFFRTLQESAAAMCLSKPDFDVFVRANGHSGIVGERHYQRDAAAIAASKAFCSFERFVSCD
jgi:hypothetical protein